MRTRSAFLCLSLLVPFAAVLAGCPSGGNGAVTGGPPVPADQLGKAVLEKVCPAIQSCCNQNGFADDFKNCNQGAAALQASFDQQRTKHPEYVYDAQKAGNCIAKIAAAYGTCNYKNDKTGDDPDCEDFLRGTKPLGADCESSSECAGNAPNRVECLGEGSSSSVDGGVATTKGVCAAIKPAAEGDPCVSFSSTAPRPSGSTVYGDCGFGSSDFYCDGATNKCKRRGGVGTSCVTVDGNSTVVDAAACSKETSCDFQSKQCVALPKAGDACNETERCSEDAYCDLTARKCVAKKAGGEACSGSGSEECLHGCDSTTKKCLTNDVGRKMCAGDIG